MRCVRKAATVPNLRLEIGEGIEARWWKYAWKWNRKWSRNWGQILENSSSRGGLELLGDPPGAKMAQDVILDASGAPFEQLLGRILAPRWAKMAPSWSTWRQDVPKMANLEPKRGNLGRFWKHLGDFFWILGAILPKLVKSKKQQRE